ncbi:MAG: TonB-dependent receptor plug domain-containing protein, partial [Thiohalorhabdaceae bacterium]
MAALPAVAAAEKEQQEQAQQEQSEMAQEGKGQQEAQDPGAKNLALDPITVGGDWSASRDDEEVRTYPGSRTVVDSEEIHDSGARNLEDALRTEPSVQVLDETGTGVLPNIGLRGLNPLRSERAQILM